MLRHISENRHPSESWDLQPQDSEQAGGASSIHGHEVEIDRADEDGFSLMELMVVLVIIGLLATVVIINVLPAADQASMTKARADISTLESAVEQYRLDTMTYPTSQQGLAALSAPPSDLARPERYRRGGYIRNLPDDPWGNPYRYEVPGRQSGGPYDIYSLGADNAPGGEAENADIGNWE